jgi:predicted MFS family arabinose efflux permease
VADTTLPNPTANRRQLEADVDRLERSLPDYSVKLVWILMAVTIVDASDRTVLATVFEDVKRAFDISDGSLGVLSSAYALVAGLSIIPFGFLADRMHRVRLIALGFLPWALAMFLQGSATSFAMMFAARMFLGTIEATNTPSTSSLIGDYYRMEKRSSMYGLQSMSGTLGYAFGLTIGGGIASAFGWRMAFYIWGIAGLATAAFIVKVLPEPPRGIADALYDAQQRLEGKHAEPIAAPQVEEALTGGLAPVTVAVDYRTIPPRQAVAYVLRIKTLWLLFGGLMLGMILNSALATWTVSYFRRYHGLSAAGGAGVIALAATVGITGILVANRVNNAYVRSGHPERRLAFAAFGNIAASVLFFFSFGSSALAPAVLLYLPASILINIQAASLIAVGADVVVPQLRGRASAVRGVLILVGSSTGPLIFGLLSDALGLRSALMVSSPFAVVGALVSLLAMRTYPADFAHARAEAYRQNLLERATAD